jgi:hypothetical protein
MKKLSLLLLDACVIIELCKVGLWDRVLEQCEILLARTVFDESAFYRDANGVQVLLSLEEDERAGRIRIVEVPPAEVMAFKKRFQQQFAGEIHAGELESLAYIFSQREANHRICSSDKAVFRVLGCLGKREQGISLEEVLKRCGLGRKLHPSFGEEYREHWTDHGWTEGFQGKALKKE